VRSPTAIASQAARKDVPVGAYKLTWLPAGATQWIRRIEMKPDVFVHEGQDTTVKDLRMALRTIN